MVIIPCSCFFCIVLDSPRLIAMLRDKLPIFCFLRFFLVAKYVLYLSMAYRLCIILRHGGPLLLDAANGPLCVDSWYNVRVFGAYRNVF